MSSRQKITEIYIDDNADINFLIHRIHGIQRKMFPEMERLVVVLQAEEVNREEITRRGNTESDGI